MFNIRGDGAKIIGQGTYGCAVSPSLKCDANTPMNYSGAVSKLMKTTDAQKELAEFMIVARVDPDNKFHLGAPKICAPDTGHEWFRGMVKKCEPVSNAKNSEMSLLILKNGGPDLDVFCKKHAESYFKSNARKRLLEMLVEMHTMIAALKTLRDNDIVHYDLKPGNILFNVETGKFNMIDFGLMKNGATIRRRGIENRQGAFHWSYPLETGFMNAKTYNRFTMLNDAQKTAMCDDIAAAIVANRGSSFNKRYRNVDIFINHPTAFTIVFAYINRDMGVPSDFVIHYHVKKFFDGLEHVMRTKTHAEALEVFMQSVDVYGLGMSLQYMINCLREKSIMNDAMHSALSSVFSRMHTIDIRSRELDIDKLMTMYEGVLRQQGILSELGIEFSNHAKQQVGNISDSSSSQDTSSSGLPFARVRNSIRVPGVRRLRISKSSSKPLSTALIRFANEDPQDDYIDLTTNVCPPDKELNHLTNRCVKRCAKGKTRNEKFRCVNPNAKTRVRKPRLVFAPYKS